MSAFGALRKCAFQGIGTAFAACELGRWNSNRMRFVAALWFGPAL